MSHRMFMWSERKALQSSGLILCDSIEVGGFSRADIVRIQHIVEENIAMLMRAWDEYFKN